MLLERGAAGEALAAFEATLKKEPNRFNATAGAAQAADKLGDKAKATAYYEKLVALATDRDSDRPALAAREAVPGEELSRLAVRQISAMKRPLTIALAVCAVAAAAGAVVLAAKSAGPRETPSGVHRGEVAVPDGPVGARPCLPLRRRRIAARRSTSICAPRSASAIAPTGVSDDEELERVADVELFGRKFSAASAGP